MTATVHCNGKADPSWEYIIRSQTHECGNWDRDHDIPFLGIFVSNFSAFCLCSVGQVNISEVSIGAVTEAFEGQAREGVL